MMNLSEGQAVFIMLLLILGWVVMTYALFRRELRAIRRALKQPRE